MYGRAWPATHHRPTSRSRNDGVLTNLLNGIAESFRRGRQRRDLAALPDHLLRDIGLGRSDVEVEIRKPFWRP